jgi:hypothetical protein
MADSYKGWLPTVASRGRLRSSKPVINLPSTRFLCRPTAFFFARVPYSSKKKRRRTAEESRTTICPVTGSQTNLSVTTILLQPHSSRQRLYIKSRQVIQTVLSYLRRLYYAYTSQHAQRQLSASKKHSRPATNLAATNRNRPVREILERISNFLLLFCMKIEVWIWINTMQDHHWYKRIGERAAKLVAGRECFFEALNCLCACCEV